MNSVFSRAPHCFIKMASCIVTVGLIFLSFPGFCDAHPVTPQSAPDVQTADADAAWLHEQLQNGLNLWFDGKINASTGVLRRLVHQKPVNIIAAHALSLILTEPAPDVVITYPEGKRYQALFRLALFQNRERARKEYKRIFPFVKTAADDGSVQAQFFRARMAEAGFAGPRDALNTMLQIRRAADGGYAPAVRELGLLYENGRGLAVDKKRAVELYRQAVNMGDPLAHKFLAVMYLNGTGVSKDVNEAIRLAKLSVKRFHVAEGAALLGELYHKGIGVPADMNEALNWYTLGGRYGSCEAAEHLAFIYDEKKDRALAAQWLQEAADLGSDAAMLRLGFYYYSGTGGMKPDKQEAFRLFRQSADLGNIGAMYNTGWIASIGDGVPKDIRLALDYLKMAAFFGSEKAIMTLGVMYANGDNVERDYKQAYYYFCLADLLGHDKAKDGLEFTRKHLSEAEQKAEQDQAQEVYERIRK